MLREQGHLVEPRIQFDKMWFEIDRRMLASAQEVEEIADGVYSFPELVELFEKRRLKESAR
jgi:hypothetical protein